MAFQYVEDRPTARTMRVDAKLCAALSPPEDHSDAEPVGWYLPAGCTAGGFSYINLGGTQLIAITPYVRFTSGEEPSFVAFGWFASWNAYIDGSPVYQAMYAEFSAEDAAAGIDFSLSCTGAAKRYAQIEGMASASYVLVPEGLADISQTIRDSVDLYEFTINIGGTERTFEWETGASTDEENTEGCFSDIELRTSAERPYYVDAEFSEDENDEPLFPGGLSLFSYEAAGLGEVTWVEGSYGRSDGPVCAYTRSYMHARTVLPAEYGSVMVYDPDGDVTMSCVAELGGGYFRSAGGTDGGAYKGSGPYGYTWASVYLHDWLGTYTVGVGADVKDMDSTSRAPVSVQTIERHPRGVVTEREFTAENGFIEGDTYVYSGSSSACITTEYVWTDEEDDEIPGEVLGSSDNFAYGGYLSWAVHATNYLDLPHADGEYIDLNRDNINELQHGGARILGIRPIWTPGDPVLTDGHYDEGSLKEPAHPPWEPLPTQVVTPPTTDPETGEPIYVIHPTVVPPYYDEVPLCDSSGALSLPDALLITVPAPGASAGTALAFGRDDFEWDDSDCSCVNAVGDGPITITSVASGAYVEVADIFDVNVRLTGTRFADVSWSLDSAHKGASAKLHLGANTWTLTGNGTTEAQLTRIDLCNPHTCGTTGDPQQSIVPYEKPLDRSLWDSGASEGVRKADDQYAWDFPKGWGVGRLTTFKIELLTAGAEYQFNTIQLVRLDEEDGGFARLYVLPQSGPWNDSCAMDDFAWFDGGGIEAGYGPNPISIIPKAFLVIDGAVVAEFAQGMVEYDASAEVPYRWYWRNLAEETIAWPLNYYGELPEGVTRSHAIAGVTIGTSIPESGFWADNCLTGFLAGGVYVPDSETHTISVPLRIMPRYWYSYPNTEAFPTAFYKRFRGQVQGLIYAETEPANGVGVMITNPNASPGAGEIQAKTTSQIGWFESDALNTKAAADVETAGLGSFEINLRSRFYSRVGALDTPLLVLRYCSTTGAIVINQDGNPSLTCCE